MGEVHVHTKHENVKCIISKKSKNLKGGIDVNIVLK